ncbi:conserved hypothetical protein [Burkholderiales bacterium 8X]|nr:conserved hypothetical protein [Burkholderiales bacterium 8X]
MTVDEPDPGSYYWLLLESGGPGEPFQVLSSARTGQPSYDDALIEGVNQLRQLCRDRRQGPRRTHETPGDNPSGWSPLI